jgi:hypothetical protein
MKIYRFKCLPNCSIEIVTFEALEIFIRKRPYDEEFVLRQTSRMEHEILTSIRNCLCSTFVSSALSGGRLFYSQFKDTLLHIPLFFFLVYYKADEIVDFHLICDSMSGFVDKPY